MSTNFREKCTARVHIRHKAQRHSGEIAYSPLKVPASKSALGAEIGAMTAYSLLKVTQMLF